MDAVSTSASPSIYLAPKVADRRIDNKSGGRPSLRRGHAPLRGWLLDIILANQRTRMAETEAMCGRMQRRMEQLAWRARHRSGHDARQHYNRVKSKRGPSGQPYRLVRGAHLQALQLDAQHRVRGSL